MGSLLFSKVLDVRRQWFLILANIIIGIGSGTLGVTVAYASEVTPTRHRTSYMAWVTAVQYAGTTVTPFIGSFFVYVFRTGENIERKGFPQINEFTTPAMFMALMSCITMYFLYFHFCDDVSTTSKTVRAGMITSELGKSNTMCCGQMSLYTGSIVACMILNAFTKGPMSCFETLGIEFAESRFSLDRAEAGSIVATMGLIGAVILILMRVSFNKYQDAEVVFGGICVFVLGVSINFTLDKNNSEMNSTWLYAISMFMTYSVGYPICHTALVGMFSKIVGRRPQGTLQGFFSASGSISRVTFPILAGYIVRYKDIEVLFSILTVILILSALFVLHFRNAFISYSM